MLTVPAGHPAMTVAGIFTEANIRDHGQIRCLFFYLPDGILDDAVLGVGTAGLFILRFRNAKENDGLQPRFVGALRHLRDFMRGVLPDTGHARDLVSRRDFFAYEKWQDEIMRVQICFANEIANRWSAA